MMSVAEATASMEFSIEDTIKYLKQEGQLLPIIHVLKKGEPITVDFEDDRIAFKKSQELDDLPQSNEIYRTIVSIKSDDDGEKRMENIDKVATRITKECQPDAICIIFPCLYNQYYKDSEETDLSKDPEAIRVLYAVCYVKDFKKPLLRAMPYVNAGILKEGSEIFSEESEYDITIANSGWQIPDKTTLVPFKNPYKTRRTK